MAENRSSPNVTGKWLLKN